MIGAYGTGIPINLPEKYISNLVDISYIYHENRTYDSLSKAEFKKLDSAVLTPAKREQNSEDVDNFIEGMYNLRLPLTDFNKKGFYTVYIKPKEIESVIADVSTLTAFPNVRGIVLDITQIKDSYTKERANTNNDLVGYRVIYLDENNQRQPFYRIITSINKCEPVVKAPTSSSDKSYTYRYEDSSSLVFATLSPSSAPSFKDNALPYIGKPTQKILLVNTMFEPIMIDIEMTTHDADTISNMLENTQIRDIDNGLITTLNDNGEIYHQAEAYTLKNQFTGDPVYEVKENRNNNVDFSQTLDNINR
jgi:hypothetical protein